MTSDGIFQFRKSLYEELSGDATLMALVGGIYDYVPENSAFPYVFLSEINALDWSTKTTRGFEIKANIEVLARERGSKKCLEIMSRIYELLHDQNLTVTGYTLVNMRVESNELTREKDGLTYSGTLKIRATIEEN